MDSGSLRQYRTEYRGGSREHARQVPELVRWSEGNPRNPQCPAEFPRDERLVVRGDIQVELGLLPVAEENGLDYPHSDLLVDMPAVLHRYTGIGVHPPERDPKPVEGRIYLLLELRGELLRRSMVDFADFEHNYRKNSNSAFFSKV